MRTMFMAGAALMLISSTAHAAPLPHATADAQALDLAEKAIALRSVRGPGNQTPQVAVLYKSALVAGGFAPGDVTITPVDDTAYLIARWHGSDAALKPLVISGHMDVVQANPADWQREPFTPVVENGFLFGRGAIDMKLDGALATFIKRSDDFAHGLNERAPIANIHPAITYYLSLFTDLSK